MPKRMSRRRIASEVVQGDGSWVDVRRMTVAEHNQNQALVRASNEAMKANDSDKIEQIERDMSALIASCVLDWNWVDDDGEALPKPSGEGMLALTLDEVEFLANAIRGNVDEKKAES